MTNLHTVVVDLRDDTTMPRGVVVTAVISLHHTRLTALYGRQNSHVLRCATNQTHISAPRM